MNTHNIRCHVLMAILSFLLFFQNLNATSEYCTPACHSQINLSLPPSGFAVMSSAFMLSGSNNCSGNWIVTTTDANGNVIPGNVVNCAYLGQLLMVSIEDADTGVNCWGNVLVEDKLPPTLTCTDVTIACSASTDPSNTGTPVVSDNCFGIPTLTYTDIPIHHNCTDPLYDVTIERTWTATDASGNSISCTQNIFLEKALLSNVVFPPMAMVDCSNPNIDPSNTGEPTLSSGGGFGGFCNLKFAHNDGPQIPTCPGGYKFVREWYVIDCCGGDVLTGIQIIEVKDTTPPVITCPIDQTVSVTSNACIANLELTLATATDNCSTPVITFSSTSGIITGNNITGLVEGMHLVQYVATDGCGNADTCEMKITVEDLIAPIAICDSSTVVALDNTGCALVRDSTFDDGSFDNCCIDTFYVRRVGDTDFNHFVKFDCNDVGESIMVEFKVQDKSGNMNFCMVEAIVQDKIPPTIVCPPDKTIDCTNYPLDNSQLGNAFASDACGIDTLFFMDDESGIDDCTKTGTILRTWTVIDLQGQVTTCIQTITIQDSNTGTPVFNVPDNITIACGTTIDPSTTGQATVTNTGCVTYIAVVSDSLDLTTDICNKKMIRTWTFVNNCTNQIEHQAEQVIQEVDNVPPVITCPNNITVDDIPLMSGQPLDCQEIVFPIDFMATATDACSGVASFGHNSQYSFSGAELTAFAGGFYPLGDTDVDFTAVDSCGNSATCTATVTVEDFTAPSFNCGGGSFFIFPTLGNPVTITGDSLLLYLNIMDDCSNPTTLTFDSTVFSQAVYSCDDFPVGVTCIREEVTLLFSDAVGNTSSCTDTLSICRSLGCLSLLAFSGVTYTEEIEMVKDFEVAVMDENNSETMINSEELGYYIYGINDPGGTYTFTPKKNNDFLNGVTTFDLVKIKKHILGNELLNSPYKMIAADASRDNQITTYDIVMLQQMILQNWDELPNNTSWRFVDAKHVFSDWTNPFADDFPEQIECVDMTTSMNSQNFIAVKIGDVNNSTSTNDLIASDTRGPQNIAFHTEDLFLEKDEIYQVQIYDKDISRLEGFQFTMNFTSPNIEFLEIEKGLLGKENFGYRFVEEGLVTCSWIKNEDDILDENSVLFFIKIKASQSEYLHQAISINSIKTNALAYDEMENVYGINLSFENQLEHTFTTKEKYILYQNQPNPFSETTEIKFYLPENSDVRLEILDVSGKTIKTFSNHYLFGEHTIELKSSVFPSMGVYIYKLITPSFSASKKMTIIN